MSAYVTETHTVCPCPDCVAKRYGINPDPDVGGPLKVTMLGFGNGSPMGKDDTNDRLQRCETAIERLAEIFKRMDRTSQEGELIKQYIRRDF